MMVQQGRQRGRLRLLGVAVPLAGLAVLYGVRLLLDRLWSPSTADIATGLLAAAGILAFAWAMFRVIARQDRRLHRQHAELEQRYETERRLRAQLEALHDAALAIASARTRDQILQRLVDLARDLIGAHYAALGVLGPEGAIDDFYTSGLSDEERTRPGPAPQGHNLLDVVLAEGTASRAPEIAREPHAVGVPPGHPLMRSLLAVPVAHGDHIVGNLYLANRVAQGAFSTEDERLLRLLASHAAIVIEHARLTERVRVLAVAAERDRIGKDLHDGVIQDLFAVNLELEEAADDVTENPGAARRRIEGAIDRIGDVMKDVRRYILGLQPADAQAPLCSLSAALVALLQETRAHTLLETDLRVEGERGDDLPPELAQEVLHIAREAVTNVVRHAHASHLWMTLEATDAAVRLRVVDNGVGFDVAAPVASGHYGLRNLHERAAALGGMLCVQAVPGQSTAIDVQVPLRVRDREETHA